MTIPSVDNVDEIRARNQENSDLTMTPTCSLMHRIEELERKIELVYRGNGDEIGPAHRLLLVLYMVSIT